MKLTAILSAVLGGALAATTATADPILYDITFDGSMLGQPGTGTITYNAQTETVSEFSWDFGPSDSGSASASLLDSIGQPSPIIYPSGSFLWNVLTTTGECANPTPADACELAFSLNPTDGTVTQGTTGSGEFDLVDDANGEAVWYGLGMEGTPALQGGVSLQEVAPVPLPSTAWLLLSALGVLGVAGRRRLIG